MPPSVRRLSVCVFFVLAASTVMGSGLQSPQAGPPAWVAEHLAGQIGTWVTDNSAYKSEQEPTDAYGMEWRWGIGQRSVVGRLYGIVNGEETQTFWEFRSYWHPGERQLLASQFGGNGEYGVGPVSHRDDGAVEMLQVFYRLDGGVNRVGHRSEQHDDTLITRSYDVAEDGTWNDRRAYTWKRDR